MLIGIDASRAAYPQRTGTENYSFHLIRHLLAIGHNHSFRLYFSIEPPADLLPRGDNWENRVIPFPRLWTHLRLSWEMIRHPPSFLFVPAHILPLLHPPRSVVAIHDIGYLYYPRAHRPLDRLYLDLSTRFNAQAASHILVLSSSTKKDLVVHYRIDPTKITVTYPGVDDTIRTLTDGRTLHRVREKYRLPDGYILYLGTIQPRKNLVLLLDAYRKLLVRGKTIPLVLAGKRGWLADGTLQKIEEWGLTDKVILPGYIAPEDLGAVLKGARVFVFPSLYEGFGFPVLEAMAVGVPVVAANASSLPEVAGDAALLVDPHDAEAWAEAMAHVLHDEDLREELVAKGRARAAAFSWEKCSRETLAILEKVGQE